MDNEIDNIDESASSKPKELSAEDKAAVQKALEILQPIADKQGVEPAELLESPEEESSEAEPEDSDKVNLIVARLKGDKGE